ncbi:MAG TPA: FAD-dependent oxidoreductase [Herpetosiphon sp.]|uniref:FAD dependent oxidoreductase n=1 Tax=Herpetosiphon aurantiacus (strain ATCC 23779 / DSM 785 / 114-95) TaxID=316274 RepID=A9AXR2_HERA2|nr:FAD-dependent oxidoreductase [Herpetosiphon sp.]ABX03476.1 FAD dependent oxidoreductase [Herpetosiphon aurantiacus DSM 785]HBW52963.1 FAD-dependent oxidoreductase [Herpetosiphon sp.]
MPPKPITIDCLIVGGGIAGCACAVHLARHGWQVLVLERPPVRPQRFGESLAPAARPLVHELGLDLDREHSICPGNLAAWGSDAIYHHDFLATPYGHGWHLNRPHFEQQLRQRCLELGVTFSSVSIGYLERQPERWIIGVGEQLFQTRWLIESTGRARWLARRLGAQTQIDGPKQLGLVAMLEPQAQPWPDQRSLVEAVADGWWYVARVPQSQMATIFIGQPTAAQRQKLALAEGWWQALKRSTWAKQWLDQHQLCAQPYWVDASSSRLDRCYGNGWLAIGDAAMSYDPLAAHGITVGLTSARDAAQSLIAANQGSVAALHGYGHQLEQAWQAYRQLRQQIYAQEQRWPNRPFWQPR